MHAKSSHTEKKKTIKHDHNKLLDSLHTFLFAFFFFFLLCVFFFLKNVFFYCECDSFCIVVYNLDYYIYAVSLSICLCICFSFFFILKCVDIVECNSVCTWLTVWKQWCYIWTVPDLIYSVVKTSKTNPILGAVHRDICKAFSQHFLSHI